MASLLSMPHKRSGYERVIQMLSGLSHSLDYRSRTR